MYLESKDPYFQGENISNFPTLTKEDWPMLNKKFMFKIFSFSTLSNSILNIKCTLSSLLELKKKKGTAYIPKRMKNGFKSKFLSPVSRNSFHHDFFFS